MLAKGSFKDGANHSDRYNQLKSLNLTMAPGKSPPHQPPHSRQAFPI